MIKINDPKEIIILTLGEQEQKFDINYRMSYFCFTKQVEKGLLIYNNLTKELLILEDNEYSISDNNSFYFNEDSKKYLVNKWFLFPENTDETVICDQVREVIRLIEPVKGINSFVILPTTGCNARCFYCFEAGSPVINMSESTANDVVKYICKNQTENKVSLVWFGGEPLCNMKVIDIICNGLKNEGINYACSMISNGYLFNEEIAKKAKEYWKMQWIQITLDGMHDTYAKVKNYINNDTNPLERVLNNIEFLCKNDIIVHIRLNLSLQNAEELNELSDLLIKRFKKYRNVVIYTIPIYENEGFEKNVYSDCDRIELYNNLVSLTKKISENDMDSVPSNIDKFKTYSCLADSKDKVLINPDGNLGFCEHNIVSDFFGSIYDEAKKPKWCDYKKPEGKCKKCVSYPSCLLLEKCSSASHKCYEYDQYLRVRMVEKMVVTTYKKYLKNSNVK